MGGCHTSGPACRIFGKCGIASSCCRCFSDRSSKKRKVNPSLTTNGKGVDSLAISAFGVSASVESGNLKLPLNEREVILLMKNWKGVQRDIIGTGKCMFLRMFEMNQDVKAVFEKFRSLDTPSEMWESAVMETHGMVVMNAIDEIICNLDDQETVLELLLTQGRSHVRFGDLSETLFWAIEDAFLHAIKETLGDRYPPHIQNLYKKTIHYIINVLVIGFKSAMEEAVLNQQTG